MVEELDDVPLPEGTLLNVNVPAGEPDGVEVTRLGKRIYRDELKLNADDPANPAGAGTGSTAPTPASTTSPGPTSPRWRAGRIAVTPIHFDLTDAAGIDALTGHDLGRLLGPAAQDVRE